MLNKIQKNFEIGKSKLNTKEVEEAKQKAAELAELEKNFETDTTDNKKTHTHEIEHVQ